MNAFKKSINSKHLFKEYINAMNGILRLSVREVEVLSLLLKIHMDWPKDRIKTRHVTSTDSRKFIIKEALINKTNLSKMIKKFKDIGLIIITEDNRHEIRHAFIPEITDNIIDINFKLELVN